MFLFEIGLFVLKGTQSGLFLLYHHLRFSPVLKGTRGIAKVAIDAAEEVVGEHLLVGCTVGVVVIYHAQHGAVGGERLKVLVLCLCLHQGFVHLPAVFASASEESEQGKKYNQYISCKHLYMITGL